MPTMDEYHYQEAPPPRFEMMRKVLTAKVEYADYGGEENFIKNETILAESFSEAEGKLARYLEGRQYRVISWKWSDIVIDDPGEWSKES
jgi:hypothetical protein